MLLGIWFIILVTSQATGFWISEVELNPSGADSGNEWVEIYSKDEVDLEFFILENNDGDVLDIKGIFQGYFIIELEGQWLDNTDEKVFLKLEDHIISETDILEDAANNDKAWSLCDDEWIFVEASKGKETDSDCEVEEEEEDRDDKKDERDEDDRNVGGDFSEDEDNHVEIEFGESVTQNFVELSENVEDKIVLNSPSGKIEKEIFVSGEGKVRAVLIWSFVFFLVVLIVLLALRKL